MSINFKKILLVVILIFITAPLWASGEKLPKGQVEFTGTVQWIQLEGGFYGIISDQGQKYLPLNLSPQYAKDQLQVKVRAKIDKKVVTFQMWGTSIQIIEIHPLK